MKDDSITSLMEEMRQFVAERGWLVFHKPRNIATALVKEAAELVELFQWDIGSPTDPVPDVRRHAIAGEIADIMMYLLRMADECDIDIATAVRAKLVINRNRWPVINGQATMPDHSGRISRQE